jgi:hypothetical protein
VRRRGLVLDARERELDPEHEARESLLKVGGRARALLESPETFTEAP